MTDVLSDEIARFVRAVGPKPDDTLREMDEYAETEGFPHVGPEVGAFLRFVARLTDAERVFEFGSGYGYSAYWFADALPANGEIVLTEVDEDELERAREYMTVGGYDEIARYELGDALETISDYDGPFDVVLLDHQKHRYVDAFEAVRPMVPVGGVIIADNAITAAPIEFETLLEIVEGQTRNERTVQNSEQDGPSAEQGDVPTDATDPTRGIAEYLECVTDDSAFETIVLPLGEGIAVSYRVE